MPSSHACADETNLPPATLRVKLWNDDATGITNATVTILKARSKRGITGLCPTCFPDCQKSATSDGDGQLKLPGLDPTLLFDLLLSAPGYETKIVTSVDPAKRRNEYTLPYIDEALLKGSTRLAGVVLDFEGRPVAGCILNCDRFERGGSTYWGGGAEYLQPMVVTDGSGRFWARCDESVTMVHAKADTRSAALEWIDIEPGKDLVVRLHEGVTVTGRLVQNGAPMPGVALGLTVQEPRMGGDSEGFAAVSDTNGNFTFRRVPSQHPVTLFAKASSLADGSAIPNRVFQTEANGTTVNLGSIVAETGFSIKGRLILPPGVPMPHKTMVYFSRNGTGDSAEITIEEDGVFELKNLPKGSVWISVRAPGMKLSKKNPSLDWYNGSIVGLVSATIPDLALLLEPGEWRYQEEQKEAPAGTNMQPSEEPLRGAKVDAKPAE